MTYDTDNPHWYSKDQYSYAYTKGVEDLVQILYDTYTEVLLEEIKNLYISYPQEDWDLVVEGFGIWGINTEGEIKSHGN